jgi:hypothetical protein
MAKLTDLAIKNAKARAKRYELSDNGSGLFVPVQPSGHKSLITRTRLNGVPIKVTHGEFGVLSLADARVLNAEAIKQAKLGIDPRDPKKLAKAKRKIAEDNTFEAVGRQYLDSPEVKQLRSVDQTRDWLERLAFPVLGRMPIADIKRSHIHALLDRIDNQNGLVAGDRTFGAIAQVLKFHAKRDDDYVLPLVPGMRKDHTQDRNRFLTTPKSRPSGIAVIPSRSFCC